MKKQSHIFFTALMFFTRIPCPKGIDHSPDILKKSTRYFSLVGLLIGGISTFCYLIAVQIFNTDIALAISMFASIWATGAFHEDGFADVCDGFGGAWTKDKILLIMKDSQLGTYGTVGLILILTLKFLALKDIPNEYIALTIISGHSISRFIAATLLFTLPYVRDPELNKTKTAVDKMTLNSLMVNAFFGLVPLVFFQNAKLFFVLIPLGTTKWWMAGFFKKCIGGQTGDCIGALQQISEVIYYLSLLALWKYIW